MADAESVAAALARLVNGTAESRARTSHSPYSAPERSSPVRDPEAIIAEAEAALERVQTAGTFVARGGEQRLERAIERATGTDESVAERGRAVRRALDAFRVAAGTDDDKV